MRVLVCGSRYWDNREYLERILDAYNAAYPIKVLIEGEARGSDSMARDWAMKRGIPVLPFPADWDKYGKAAGPIRNRQMLREGQPETVIAFTPDLESSRGTRDMVTAAREAGIGHIYVAPFSGYKPAWSPLW